MEEVTVAPEGKQPQLNVVHKRTSCSLTEAEHHVFSTLGHVCHTRRSSMTPSHADLLVFIHRKLQPWTRWITFALQFIPSEKDEHLPPPMLKEEVWIGTVVHDHWFHYKILIVSFFLFFGSTKLYVGSSLYMMSLVLKKYPIFSYKIRLLTSFQLVLQSVVFRSAKRDTWSQNPSKIYKTRDSFFQSKIWLFIFYPPFVFTCGLLIVLFILLCDSFGEYGACGVLFSEWAWLEERKKWGCGSLLWNVLVLRCLKWLRAYAEYLWRYESKNSKQEKKVYS